jgi:hypothetical protein
VGGSSLSDETIKNRIKESKRAYNKKSQKAALYLRNEIFNDEKAKVLLVIGKLYEIGAERSAFFEDLAKYGKNKLGKHLAYRVALFIWEMFCDRWDISFEWNGEPDQLKYKLKKSADIDYQKNKTEREDSEEFKQQVLEDDTDSEIMEQKLDEYDMQWLHWKRTYLRINIDAYATIDDVKNIWGKIKKLQRKVFLYKSEAKSNFGRDLCWYDLRKNYGLSIGKIADYWIRFRSDDADIIALNYFKKKNRPEIRKALRGETTLLNVDKEKELLNKILSGSLKEELYEDFNQEREYYLKGKFGDRKLCAPFQFRIKMAIKRFEEYIERT